MSDAIDGSDGEVLAKVQSIFDAVVPGAVCELQDYNHRIGCGTMDRWDQIQDVVFLRRGVTEKDARHYAEVLSRKVASGGSTAGPPIKTDC